jgi:hypothetical protein
MDFCDSHQLCHPERREADDLYSRGTWSLAMGEKSRFLHALLDLPCKSGSLVGMTETLKVAMTSLEGTASIGRELFARDRG